MDVSGEGCIIAGEEKRSINILIDILWQIKITAEVILSQECGLT